MVLDAAPWHRSQLLMDTWYYNRPCEGDTHTVTQPATQRMLHLQVVENTCQAPWEYEGRPAGKGE